jgi:hypothetical protein
MEASHDDSGEIRYVAQQAKEVRRLLTGSTHRTARQKDRSTCRGPANFNRFQTIGRLRASGQSRLECFGGRPNFIGRQEATAGRHVILRSLLMKGQPNVFFFSDDGKPYRTSIPVRFGRRHDRRNIPHRHLPDSGHRLLEDFPFLRQLRLIPQMLKTTSATLPIHLTRRRYPIRRRDEHVLDRRFLKPFLYGSEPDRYNFSGNRALHKKNTSIPACESPPALNQLFYGDRRRLTVHMMKSRSKGILRIITILRTGTMDRH